MVSIKGTIRRGGIWHIEEWYLGIKGCRRETPILIIYGIIKYAHDSKLTRTDEFNFIIFHKRIQRLKQILERGLKNGILMPSFLKEKFSGVSSSYL